MDMDLFDPQGRRLYLTEAERGAFLDAAKAAELPARTFCLVLHYTGCRISEALALTPRNFDFAGKTIVFETLKKRRKGVFRAVPVPAEVLDTLNMVHGLQRAGKRRKGDTDEKPVWEWSRTTGWRRVKEVMEAAGIANGPHKTTKGLRHGYGIAAVSNGVPPNMLKKWMGHASLKVTEVYCNAMGEEQHKIAARMWT